MNAPEPTQLQKYIDNLVDKIASKEGGCSRLRKATKVEFWLIYYNFSTLYPNFSNLALAL